MACRSRFRTPFKRAAMGALALTTRPKYSNVCPWWTEFHANHVECANIPHGSDPTLGLAVTGLQRIIHARLTPVLRDSCGPTDSSVYWGRVVFRHCEAD